MKGIDYSQGRPWPLAILAAKYQYAMRYLPFDGSNRQDLTDVELNDLWRAGLGVGFVWETMAGRAGDGAMAGYADGGRADASALSVGAVGVPTWFTVDYDAEPADVEPYFVGLNDRLRLDRIFAYGSYRVCRYLLDRGLVSGCWQTTGWSGGQWDARFHQIQRLGYVYVDGVECDVNEWNTEAHPTMPGIVFGEVTVPRTVPPWPLPRDEWFGLITGPDASHGGANFWERSHVLMIQKALQRKGFAPDVPGWADGVYEQPTADAVAAWQREAMPGTTRFGEVWWDDWPVLLG